MKPRVLIVGIQSGQIDRIDREFGKSARLTFHSVGDNLHQLGDRVRGATHVFVMTAAIDHKAYQVVRANAPGRMTHLTGAVSKLKEALGAYLSLGGKLCNTAR